MSGKRSGRATVRTPNDEDAELPTELCMGSDGNMYVNAEGIDPKMLAGRKMFYGYAMTPTERKVAAYEIHRLAFNITVSVQEAMRQRRLERIRQQQQGARQQRQARETMKPGAGQKMGRSSRKQRP